jgi:hypothetical protein
LRLKAGVLQIALAVLFVVGENRVLHGLVSELVFSEGHGLNSAGESAPDPKVVAKADVGASRASSWSFSWSF